MSGVNDRSHGNRRHQGGALEVSALSLVVASAVSRLRLLGPVERLSIHGSFTPTITRSLPDDEGIRVSGVDDAQSFLVFEPSVAVSTNFVEQLTERHPNLARGVIVCAPGGSKPAGGVGEARSLRLFETLGAFLERTARRFGFATSLAAGFTWWGGPAWITAVGKRFVKRKRPRVVAWLWQRENNEHPGREGENHQSPRGAVREGVAKWVTSCGGLGIFCPASGTLASAVTAAAIWLVLILSGSHALFWAVACGLLIVSSLGCYLLERDAERAFHTKDAREVVLDEVAGMSLCAMFVPSGAGFLTGALVAFCAFRFFDIFKPGISWVERRGWRGAVLWDDLLAGLYAGISVWVTLGLVNS